MSKQDKSHEMLVMWMDVNRAVAALRRAGKAATGHEIVPWASNDTKIKLAWKKLTEPSNLSALKMWQEAASTEKSRLWTEKAIRECRRRLAKKLSSG